MRGNHRSNIHRQRLAYEAARIMADQGVREFDQARRKAAARAGISNRRLWPNNAEIQEALLRQRRLFRGNRQELEIRSLREQALAAMRAFADFEPRLVGPVLSGSADSTHEVRLHLFTDNPEDIVFALLDQNVPWQQRDEVLRYGGGVRRTHPVFAFIAGGTPFALIALPVGAQRNPPLDPVSDRPQRGVAISEVVRLLDEASA